MRVRVMSKAQLMEEADVLVDTCEEAVLAAREAVRLYGAAKAARRKGVSRAVSDEAFKQLGEIVEYLYDVVVRQASMRFPGGVDAQAARVVRHLTGDMPCV